jgi:hypothetical protein
MAATRCKSDPFREIDSKVIPTYFYHAELSCQVGAKRRATEVTLSFSVAKRNLDS